MSEYNTVIKKEVEDPSYSEIQSNDGVPETAVNYMDSSEFITVKIEREYPDSSLISHIKEEPLDLALDCPDSPQLPDSTTDNNDFTIDTNEVMQVKAEPCENVEVEVQLELLPTSDQVLNEGNQVLTKEIESKTINSHMKEKLRRNEIKTKFTIENGKFSCLICHKLYMTKCSIVRHLLNHPEKDFYNPPVTQEQYKCDKCGKTFKSATNLQQHSYIHLDNKLFQCERCQRSFTIKSNFIRHQGKSQCRSPDSKIICKVCNKEFLRESLLKTHMKKHSYTRPFMCDDCGMSFKFKSTLVRHCQHHNGIKPYSCGICNKKFTSYGLIRPHMRTHTGERPFTCPVCKKSFTHKHNMLRHSLRHEKVVNLNCPVCDKKFPKESRLKYHMKSHVDEKSFSCGICPKKFSHRQNVIRHYSRKHPNAIYDSTETDASVALKLWNELKNNERPLSEMKIKKSEVKIQEVNIKIRGVDEEEAILPDIQTPDRSIEFVNIEIKREVETD